MKTIISTLVVILFASFIQAQTLKPTVINAAGQKGSTSTAIMIYSIGEVVIGTLKNTQNMLTQGFIQPFLGAIGIQDVEPGNELDVYPNPVHSFLTVQDNKRTVSTVEIINSMGAVILDSPSVDKAIDVVSLSPGLYFLKINYEHNISPRFVKIIKQ